MKRNRLLTLLVSVLMIFVIAGCSNANASGQTNTNSNGNAGKGNKNGFQKPDVYGEVSAIAGNKVTLKLMEIPQMSRRNGQNSGNGSGNGLGNGSGGGWNNGNGNNNSNGSGSGWNNGNGNNNSNGGPGRGGMHAKKYTGEEKTIEIPNGVSIVTMTRGANGMTQNDISMSDLTIGDTLSIYNNSDGKTIQKVRVQKPRTGNGQVGNTTN